VPRRIRTAETTENPIYRKIVVTDDKGKFVISELPYATYSLWVRGNCLKDSTPIQVTPGPNSIQLHAETSPAEWTLPNNDLWQHRRACSEIDSSNVNELAVAWTRELTATSVYGALASNSLIFDGTVYIMDNDSNVAAVDLESGDTKWTREYNAGPSGPTA
jgi:glucose dehydrogenase